MEKYFEYLERLKREKTVTITSSASYGFCIEITYGISWWGS